MGVPWILLEAQKTMHRHLLLWLIVLFVVVTILFGCALTQKSFKERTLDDMYPVLTEQQYDTLKYLNGDETIQRFMNNYWNDVDTTENISQYEYQKRLDYANEHYPDKQGRGRSAQKKIYLLYGPPASIERSECIGIPLGIFSTIKSMEIWLYMAPGKRNSLPTKADNLYAGQMRFIFGYLEGDGMYQLLYSSENNADIDPRMYYQH
jgi:GWxTD domain-containing protein